MARSKNIQPQSSCHKRSVVCGWSAPYPSYLYDARHAPSTDTNLASQTGASSISKSKLNWGQHTELKLQAVLFIHINLAKVAKRTKLIRLIDFFPPFF